MVISFHKPYGVLCQFTPDEPGQPTLAGFGFPPDVYPVGRLDMDSEGLLLLTDEPGFNNRLLDPRASHPRTYLAQVEGIPDLGALQRLRAGNLEIRGHRTRPCKVELVKSDTQLPPRQPPVRFRREIPTSFLELTLTEGKNRQVRRMTAAVGHPTLRLIRTSIGKFPLGNLAPGAWKTLNPAETALVWRK